MGITTKNLGWRAKKGGHDDSETKTPKGCDSSTNKKYSYNERGNLMDIEGRQLRGLSNADYTFDSLNRYSYVHNNPLIYTDPSGQYIMPMGPTPSLTCAVDIKNCKTNLDAQIKASQENLDMLYLDDVRTIMDGEASKLEKGIVIVQYIPVFKAYKLVKKTEKAIDSSKDIIKTTKKLNCNCFTAGTKVLTDEGEKPIEEIEVGDKLLAKSDETGEVAYKEVVGLFQKQANEITMSTSGMKSLRLLVSIRFG